MTIGNEQIQEAIALGLIDLGSVQKLIIDKRIEKLKAEHPYKITPPCSPKARWQTSYRDDAGKIHNIKAATEEKLWEKLAEVHINGFKHDTTLNVLFNEWIKYKGEIVSPNTIKRHKQHYGLEHVDIRRLKKRSLRM